MSVLDIVTVIEASDASSNAQEAKRAARNAQVAAEETLESGYNPMIIFEYMEIKEIPESFWNEIRRIYKKKLSTETKKVCIKLTDISHLEEAMDDFGTKCVVIHLESRCDFDKDRLFVKGSIEEVQNYINNLKKEK